jgi:SET domain-containing protein
MLLIKTFVGPCKYGNGLFTSEFIKKGTKIQEFVEGFDHAWTQEEVAKFPKPFQEFLSTYSHKCRHTNKFVLEVDHSRFQNHSDNPNTQYIFNSEYPKGALYALEDIEPNTELTVNYGDFEKKEFWGF